MSVEVLSYAQIISMNLVEEQQEAGHLALVVLVVAERIHAAVHAAQASGPASWSSETSPEQS